MELSRQEYWSGLPFPSPGDLPDPGIEPMSPALAGRFFSLSHRGSPFKNKIIYVKSEFFLQLSYIHHLFKDTIEHLLYIRHCFRPWEYSEQNKACPVLAFTLQWKKTDSNGVKSNRFSQLGRSAMHKIVQTWEQECPSMGEGKLVLISGIVREGFTDKVVFEKMPDKCEWKSKELSSRK